MSNYNTNFSTKSKGLPSYNGGIFPVYKKSGETLATLIQRFRIEESINEEIPITYAGRLDPMANGLVLLLTGDKCKKKDNYLGLDKTYVFEVLFGFSTDTYDMLGLIQSLSDFHPSIEEIELSMEKIKNIKEFAYPSYSSKPVDGKPLFVHAKEGTLPQNMPTMDGKIKSLELKNIRKESLEDIWQNSLEVIKKVDGDFRQEKIINNWQDFLKENTEKKYTIATFEVSVSTGVYIRTLSNIFGGLAYSIKRIKVGDFEL